MADVSADDRGQLILVGGIVVAFALVALVLLLNTALFAENVATRGLGPAPDRASDHATAAERAADRILRHEESNRSEYESWDNAKNNTTRNIRRVEEVVRARQFQDHSAFATVEPRTLRKGTALVQNQSRNFTAGGVNTFHGNWTLANTTGIRNFTMTVDAADTSNKSAPRNFTVLIRGGSGRDWSAEVYNNSGVVEIHTNGVTCTSTTPVAIINWTDGNLDGCSFPFAVDSSGDALDDPYNVTFENGSNASGTYHLVVINESTDHVVEDNFGAPNTTENPRLYHAVYSACLNVHYEEATVDYETHVRAAPGEPEQTMPRPPSC